MPEVISLEPRIPEVRRAVLKLLENAFGSFSDSYYEHILTSSPQGTMLYAILERDEIVGINAFIAHSVHRRGKVGLAFQSCLSATRNDQKGRGHFSRIINFAKEDLKARGGAFIFGFPNRNSGPIFLEKLGFTVSNSIPCLLVRAPLVTLWRFDQDVLMEELAKERRVYFDVHEAAAWKRGKDESTFVEFEGLTNYIFGRIVTRVIFGVRLNVFVIGGYEINKPYTFNALVEKALQSSGANVARVSVNSCGPLAAAARFRRDPMLTEPIIAHPLNWNVDAKDVEACSGVKDVY